MINSPGKLYDQIPDLLTVFGVQLPGQGHCFLLTA
jgi:hypothetical protein